MVYSKESSKWKAYQFSDPFAAGAFYVCNKINSTFCRPDCDARPITNLKSEIKFVYNPSEAIAYGYNACTHCDPLNLPIVDVNLLIKCVTTVNKKIGFVSPLLDDNEVKNNEKIKENILELKRNDKSLSQRRSSAPVVNFDAKAAKDYDNTMLSKNDSDHYRLVDLACRHLALAAALSTPQNNVLKAPSSPEESGSPGKKRRRRGGVLGFKELAAKSKLSAWHFHRVFKSVTGLTPKNYGDRCAEFIKNASTSMPISQGVKRSHSSDVEYNSTVYQTPSSNTNDSDSHPTSPESINAGYNYNNNIEKIVTQPSYKKMKIESIPENFGLDSYSIPLQHQFPQSQMVNFDAPPLHHSQSHIQIIQPTQQQVFSIMSSSNNTNNNINEELPQNTHLFNNTADFDFIGLVPESKLNYNIGNGIDQVEASKFNQPSFLLEEPFNQPNNFFMDNCDFNISNNQFSNAGYLEEAQFSLEYPNEMTTENFVFNT